MIEIYTGNTPKEYEYVDFINSSEFYSKNFISDIGSGLKSMVGGKLGAWSKMQEEGLEKVKFELLQKAQNIGADAIIYIRFDTVTLADSIGIVGYGTAVKYK